MNNTTSLIPTNPALRMTSLEIAKLSEKNHFDVMRDIRNLIDQEAIDQSSFALISYLDQMNRTQPAYSLDFEASMVLVTGYDAKRRSAVIKRWIALERGEATPAAYLGSSAIDAMTSQIIQMVVPAVVSQAVAAVMKEVAPLVQSVDKRVQGIQINFSHVGNIWSFASVCCREGNANTYVAKDELYAAYLAYCASLYSTRAEGKTSFLTKLYRAFLNTHAGTIRIQGRKVPVVMGMALLPGYREIIADEQRKREQEDAEELARRRQWLSGLKVQA
jgi:hypothetical protein